MSTQLFYDQLRVRLNDIEAAKLTKKEHYIVGQQAASIQTTDNPNLINMCANNYLGLANHPQLIEAAKRALDEYGFGMASVRFICGTQTIHQALERKIADFLGTEDSILFCAAFDANGGVFEPLFGEQDAIISDSLNHASIIDGIRLCKAQRLRYAHNDMADLEAQLQKSLLARHRIIVTDGVFSMDGTIAQLDKIYALAQRYNALIMIDECHATGFMGATGRGTHEYHHLLGKIDIITGTLGKALGGASGGFVAAKKAVVDILRQQARPYLFSNALAPSIVGASLAVFDLLSDEGLTSQQTQGTALRAKLWENTAYFREKIQRLGFKIKPGIHPICPIMLGDAALAQTFAQKLYEAGVYAVGFYYPVVPQGQARIRVQISAAHTFEMLDHALNAFAKIGRELKVIEH